MNKTKPMNKTNPMNKTVTTKEIVLIGLMAGFGSATMAEENKSAIVPIQKEGDHSANLSTLNKKLADPTSSVWALFTEFDFVASDGDLTHGTRNSQAVTFEPLLPIPLTADLKMMARPTIPVFRSEVASMGAGGKVDWDRETGLGDIELPLLFGPSKSATFNWLIGPTLAFPTASDDSLGTGKWQVGPAVMMSWKKDKITAFIMPQYFWSYAGDDDRGDVSRAKIIYGGFYELENNWSIGINPTITYNHNASSGNQWNVPVGLTVTKMTKFGKLPIKIQLGVEYSIINEDDYGKEWMVKLNLIPVIKSLVTKPLFD
jgi:hypothetical protein